MYRNPNPKNDWKPHEKVYFWDIQGMTLQEGVVAVVIPDDERTILYIKHQAADYLDGQDAAYCFTDMKTAIRARTEIIAAMSKEIAAEL